MRCNSQNLVIVAKVVVAVVVVISSSDCEVNCCEAKGLYPNGVPNCNRD